MLPYLLLAGVVLLYSNKNEYRIILLVLLLFAVLRYDVGWDYMSYYDIARNPEADHDFYRFSFFWQQILLLSYHLSYPELAIIIPSILICLFAFAGIYLLQGGHEEKVTDALLVYTFWPYFYLSTFSTIRQGLAISICLVIYAFLKRERLVFASLLFVFNLFIHPSSIISIVMFPLLLKKTRVGLRMVLICIGVGLFVLSVASVVLSYVGMYMNYLQGDADFGKGLAVLLLMIGSVLLLCMYVAQKQDVEIEYIGIVVISFFLEAAIYLLGLPSVMSRVLAYFSILFIFVVFDAVRIVDFRLSRIALILTVLLFFWYLNHTTLSDGGSSGYIPYKTIFVNDEGKL